MVWRLAHAIVGRDPFTRRGPRRTLAAGKQETDGLTLARVRAALNERGGAALKTILDQELDQPTDMDLLVGTAAAARRTVDWRPAKCRFLSGESDRRRQSPTTASD